MARIVVSENVSLDGVVEDPVGDEGFRQGGWGVGLGEKDQVAWATFFAEEALRAEALLLGRRTYEFFAKRWPSRSGAWADRLNGMPKYVVASSLTDPSWNNSVVLNGEVVDAVSNLKRTLDGEIIVYGSRPLVAALMEHDLVDELRLIVFGVVLGDGERLFGPSKDKKTLRLLGAKTAGDNLAVLTYQISDEPDRSRGKS